MPFVLVTDFETGRSLGGSRAAFRGGSAGFEIGDESPIASETVKPKTARDEKRKPRALESDTGQS